MPSTPSALALRLVVAWGVLSALATRPVLTASAQPDDELDAAGYLRVVRYESGRLSADITDMPLRSLLLELGRQSGARVRIDGLDDRNVSDAFEQLPLEEALRRLLGDRSFTLTYSQDRSGEGRAAVPQLKELRVYGGEGAVVTSPGRKPARKDSATRPTAAGPSAAGVPTLAKAAKKAKPPAAPTEAAEAEQEHDSAEEESTHAREAEASPIAAPAEPEPLAPAAVARPGPLNPVAGVLLGDHFDDEDEWSNDTGMDEPDEDVFDNPGYDDDYDDDEESLDD